MMRAAGLGNEDAKNFLDNFVNNLLNVVIPEDGPTYHAILGKVEWIRRFLNLSESNRRLWRVSLENFLTMSSHRKTLRRGRFNEVVYSLLMEMEDGPDKKLLDLVQRGFLRTAVQYSPHRDEVRERGMGRGVCMHVGVGVCVCLCMRAWSVGCMSVCNCAYSGYIRT